MAMSTSTSTAELFNSVKIGDFEKLKILINDGADIRSKDKWGNTALHIAAKSRHQNIVTYILKHYPDLKNDENKDGGCALHSAAQGGSVDIYKLLIESGLSYKSMTKRGFTPLHLAAKFDQNAIVQYILETTPDLLEYNSFDGSHPLHSCGSGKDTKCYDLLIQQGVSPKVMLQDGKFVQHVAARCGNLKLVKHILDNNPYMLNYQDGNGCTALHAGAVSGNVEMYKYLVEQGLSQDLAPHDGRTVLHIAARRNRIDLVNFLLQHRPSLLHVIDADGNTAMHHAAMFGNIQIYDILLKAGLSPQTKTKHGKTTGDIAAMYNHSFFLKHMIEADLNSDGAIPSSRLVTIDKTYIDRYLKAITDNKDGKARNIRLIVVGHEGTGKTSLCKHMLEENIPEEGPGRTDGIDIYVQRFVIDMATRVRSKLLEGSEHETSLQRIKDVINTFERKLKLSESDGSLEETRNEAKSITDKEKLSVETANNLQATQSVGNSSQSATRSSTIHSETLKEDNIQDIDESELAERFRMIPEEHHADVQKVLRTMSNEEDSSEEKCYVSLWDFGGEKDYYNTHHIFLTSDAVYLLVFNLYDCLSSDKSLERIVYWLRSISTYSTDDSAERGVPPIILVGTHLDLMKGGEDEIKQAIQDIYRRLNDIPEAEEVIRKHVRAYLTLSNVSKEEKTLKGLWDTILSSARFQSQWESKLPGTWLALERVLMKKKSEGIKVQTFQDICEMNWNLEASIHSEDEIFVFLRYLHLTGNIIVCCEDNPESAVIIIDPQWLTHAFRRLITSPKFQNFNIEERLGILWPGYEKTAKLSMELIDLAWSRDQNQSFIQHKDALLYVMEKFGLIAQPLMEDTSEDDENSGYRNAGILYKYIVPCMLPDADPEVIRKVLEQENTVRTCTLCFVSKRDFVQFSIFDKVIASCIQRFQPFEDISFDISICIQRGFVCLSVTPVWNMILCCKDGVMKVTLFKFSTSDYIEDGSGFNVRVILQNLLQMVLEMTHQGHLEFDVYLHCDFKVSNKETRVRASDLLTASPLPCTSSEIQGKRFLTKKDYGVWFTDPKDLQTSAEDEEIDVPLSNAVLDRRPTEREMARTSKFIGGSYLMFFYELGLSSECIDQIRISYSPFDLQSQIAQMLIRWANLTQKPTIRHILLAMKNMQMNYQNLIDNKVFVR